ncbi:MAG: hypothetical protein WBC73_20970 [Phormidesmis sp.]
MEAQVAAALEVKDYQQVSRLLKQWQMSEPTNPLLRLYAAQLQESTNRLEAAEKNYLTLLKQAPSSRMMSQARAGLGRIRVLIQQRRSQQKAEALEQARQISGGNEIAVLAIASPPPTHRQVAIEAIANVFNLDPYTARMKVPTSGLRLHRIGPWGEVRYYAAAIEKHLEPPLGKAYAPATIAAKVADIQALQTFQISYFELLSPRPSVVCKNVNGQLGTLCFDWSEVAQRVNGQLPIFEQVVDLGPWGKTVHREEVQDYAQVIDFHLPGRQVVLRVCDRLYQYKKGVSLTSQRELNSRIQWNQLLKILSQSTHAPQHNDFTRFGKGTLEFIDLLPTIQANLDLARRAPSDWDQAFHLYSSLCYFNVRT